MRCLVVLERLNEVNGIRLNLSDGLLNGPILLLA